MQKRDRDEVHWINMEFNTDEQVYTVFEIKLFRTVNHGMQRKHTLHKSIDLMERNGHRRSIELYTETRYIDPQEIKLKHRTICNFTKR